MTFSRLVFDKCEYMQTLTEYFQNEHDSTFYHDVVEFIHSCFVVKDSMDIQPLYRVFYDSCTYRCQLDDLEKNKYHFNAYYIDKYDRKTLKNYGPGFYTLGTVTPDICRLLKYRITLQYTQDTCTCAVLKPRMDPLLVLFQFKKEFKHRLMTILNITETRFDSYFHERNEHFFVLFFAYFRSLDVKFVLFFSDTYQSWIHVYIDECTPNPFRVLDTTHAY